MRASIRSNPSAAPADGPLVTRQHDGRRMIVAAADANAQALGLHAGMALAQAQALVPGLRVHDADPAGDKAAISRLAAWCLRLAPLTAPDADGLWIDVTGCVHLHGGEAAMLERLLERLAEEGIAARAALADTPGAAWGVARYREVRPRDFKGSAFDGVQGQRPWPFFIVPPGTNAIAIAPLPIAALRLESETVLALSRLGFETVGALAATPRAPLARRFGAGVLLRLDQAHGRVAEPITPVFPPDTPARRMAFPEPLLTAEAFATVIGRLTRQVCTDLERTGQGARQVDLLFERVDGTVQAVRIGTARPTRAPQHLGRLLAEQIETVDPGLGVEAMHLVVPLAEPLAYAQTATLVADAGVDIAALVDRLSNRLGASRVWRAAPMESDVPERSVRRVAALAPADGRTWPAWPRPARLLTPPQPVEALALLPDHPPAAFTWRRIRHRVRRADGPERIAGEWWRRDAETAALRDYWQVEDDSGRRFWLYRRGDGIDPATGDLRWFLHGMF
jgi:protein ImuB